MSVKVGQSGILPRADTQGMRQVAGTQAQAGAQVKAERPVQRPAAGSTGGTGKASQKSQVEPQGSVQARGVGEATGDSGALDDQFDAAGKRKGKQALEQYESLQQQAQAPQPGQNRLQVGEQKGAAPSLQVLMGGLGQAGGVEDSRNQFRQAVADKALNGLANIYGNLAKILDKPGKINVISQSTVLSESSVVDGLWKEAQGSPAGRAKLAQTLGLPADADERTLGQGLVDQVHQSFNEFWKSDAGKKAKGKYDEITQGLEQSGILRVVTAKDAGPIAGELSKLGVKLPADFTHSLLVNDNAIIAGAEPGLKVDAQTLLAPDSGRKNLVLTDPPNKVSTLVAEMLRRNPKLEPDDVRNILDQCSGEQRGLPQSARSLNVTMALDMAKTYLKMEVAEHMEG